MQKDFPIPAQHGSDAGPHDNKHPEPHDQLHIEQHDHVEQHDHIHTEGDEGPDPVISRRSFLAVTGFSLAGTVLAGCSRPADFKAVPFADQPENVVPGTSLWYASTCRACTAGCGVLVKNRDGRPIKIEGNPAHPLSRGGLCMVGQASLLGLYDSKRLKQPLKDGAAATWQDVDTDILARLKSVHGSGGAVRVLSGTVTSPTLQRSIDGFLARFPGAAHVSYDALSCAALLDVHAEEFGVRAVPKYRFDRAKVIASFDADFLGTWISPVEYTKAYTAGRTLSGPHSPMSRHIQVESRMTLTGANADTRRSSTPRALRAMLLRLAVLIAAKPGVPVPDVAALPAADETFVADLARRLWEARGASIVLCGLNDPILQHAAHAINRLLGNYGMTIDIDRPSRQKQGDDRALARFVGEVKAGSIGALVIVGVNPVYDLPDGDALIRPLKNIPLTVCIASHLDETSSHAAFVCPDHHPLESWGDDRPVAGVHSLTQPVIAPLGSTRSAIESFARWSGNAGQALDLLRETWRAQVWPWQTPKADFETFWDTAVQNGFAETGEAEGKAAATTAIAPTAAFPVPMGSNEKTDGAGFTILLHSSVAMREGQHAHNAWLYEIPDPVTKTVWNAHATLSPAEASRLGVKDGDVVRIASGARFIELPVIVQPGQADGTVAVPLGYGRLGTDRFAKAGPRWLEGEDTVQTGELVGKNAAPLTRIAGGYRTGECSGSITRTGRSMPIARSQEYPFLVNPGEAGKPLAEPRPIVQETTLAEYAEDPAAGAFQKAELHSLWPDQHTYPGHRWGMTIDLSACTGCSACVAGCQVENNIPVVGKDEVRRNRELHWLRIDRYYEERGDDIRTAFQPMMCQQCGNAPCETVCPVLATVHSSEGLNQQVYNRCVGTRYCMNNCPYKMRRFNWFDYAHENRMENLVLNPDVTVRMRGVMEKCTFCVQRIEEAKIDAKRRGEPLADGAIKTACEQSCPADAIVFGDMNDPKSRVSRLAKDPRTYRVLEELNVLPSVGYMTLVRNRDAKEEHHG